MLRGSRLAGDLDGESTQTEEENTHQEVTEVAVIAGSLARVVPDLLLNLRLCPFSLRGESREELSTLC